MRRIKIWNLVLWIGILLIPTGIALGQVDDDDDDEWVGAREPAQFYLMASITDHVNMGITEDRLRRILPMLDRYRKAHPKSAITATILFSGAVSQALLDRNPQTHILDFVKDYVRRGVIEVGYDGTDEPTYKNRPMIEFKVDSPEARWLARASAAERFLTEARDPVTGDPQPGKTGGLNKMQEVFGEATCITGVMLGVPGMANTIPDFGSDSETVHQISRYNTQGIMFGVPEENLLHSANYRRWAEVFSKDWSAHPLSPPELFWQDGVLRTSESSGRDNQLYRASNGAAAFSYVLKMLDRNRVRVIHIELGSERNYLKKAFTGDFVYPPTRYAYAHTDHPQLPAEALLDKSVVDAAFAREDELIDWLVDDYMPEHHRTGFVSNASLKAMTQPAWGYDLPVKALRAALEKSLKNWGDSPAPPKYLNVQVGENDHYLSLAEMFQVMVDALAEQSRTGNLPQTVRVAEVHGPLEVVSDMTPVLGEVTARSVAQVSAGLVAKLHDTTWSPVPNNVVPTRVKVDGLDLNPAQFLRLMAEALLAPSLDSTLTAKTVHMFSSPNILGMRTRSARDMGVGWTYKPAPLSLIRPVLSASN
jgi:hypothetical protein